MSVGAAELALAEAQLERTRIPYGPKEFDLGLHDLSQKRRRYYITVRFLPLFRVLRIVLARLGRHFPRSKLKHGECRFEYALPFVTGVRGQTIA